MDTKLYKQIIKDISDKIISGELEPGSRLPSENELMDIYNASKSTIEKSMMILAHEGYILTIPRKGNYITRPALDHFSLHYREDELLSSMFAGLNDFEFSITPVGSEMQSLVIKKTFDVDKKNICYAIKQYFFENTNDFRLNKNQLLTNSDLDILLLFNKPLELQKQITLVADFCPEKIAEKIDVAPHSAVFFIEILFTHRKTLTEAARFKTYFNPHYLHLNFST